MYVLKIDGAEYPQPDAYKVDVEPVGRWERNSEGMLVGDFVAYKTKLFATWGVLSGEQLSAILGGVDTFWLTIEYLDPRTNGYSTGTFYASPRSSPLIFQKNGKTYWKDVSFNLIEQ
ncbi:MAG: hypothetical protein LBB94_05385 [Clostridiales bacterium]|nr:hypothetical protein [Clostridiales bacterium]